MKATCLVATFLVLTLCAGALQAESPTKIEIELSRTGATVQASGAPSGIADVGPDGALLTIRCGASLPDCTGANARLSGDAVTLEGENPKTAMIDASDISAAGSRLLVRFDNIDVAGVTLRNSATPPPSSAASGCSLSLEWSYDMEHDIAQFVVTPGGSILVYPTQPVDEDDRVIVHVLGDRAVVDNIEVARTSATRQTGEIQIVGAGTGVKLQSKKALDCAQRQFTLGDFAPGEATVEMYTVANNQKTTLGTFKFNVNRLYHGILSFGAAWTRNLGDASFKLAPQGDKMIIVADEEGKRDILYTVGYTYYAWGRRDLEKGEPRWYAHVNPTLAVSVEHLTDHALAGATVDAGQLLFSVGIHFAHVTRLNSASGLAPGSTFAGTADQIPTAERWQSHVYMSVSVDLRAAGALLKALGI